MLPLGGFLAWLADPLARWWLRRSGSPFIDEISAIADDQIGNDAALLAAAIAANGGSATLAPGASLTFTYVSDAPLNLDANDTLTNTVTVSGTDDEETPVSGTASATVGTSG